MKVCKYCGRSCEDAANFCPGCGAAEFQNLCANCGSRFSSAFCPNCGTKAGFAGYVCPKCRTPYFSHACPNCGYVPSAGVNIPTQEQPVQFRIQQTGSPTTPQKKKHGFWYWFGIVLLWVYFTPVMCVITTLKLWRNPDKDKVEKIIEGILLLLAFIVSIVVWIAAIAQS